MRRPGPARTLLGAVVLFSAVTFALAVQYVESTIHDPDDVPDSGDECLIDFIAPQDTPQSRADVGNMRQVFEFALANSQDMQTKVEDACLKHGDHLEIVLFRDDPKVYGGETYLNGIIVLDPGDLDDMPNDMLGAPDEIQYLGDHLYLWALAHEIDHNRTTDTDDHLDPSPADQQRGVTGPAVDDETMVFEDLGVEIERNNYTVQGLDGKVYIDFTVKGRAVTLELTESIRVRRALNRLAAPAVHVLGPSLLLINPGEPCVPGSSPTCYPLIGDNDVDHDGVPDGIDNCIDRANPQQANHDLDSEGSCCDHDDDTDGTSRAVEAGTGSRDYDASSKPEHWACAGDPAACGTTTNPCTDGIDNDLDGHTDLDDPACVVPDPSGFEFPIATPPGALVPHYHRLDHGGVTEKQDALLASATLNLDLDVNGSVDSVVQAIGVIVVSHDPPFLGGGGFRTMQGSLLELELHGTDATLGDFTLHSVHGSDNPFELTAKQTGSDFPASGQIDYTISLDTQNFGQLDHVTAGLQSSFIPWWQPFETIWNSFGGPMIFSPEGGGSPVVEIVSMGVNLGRDTEFDGVLDHIDNCPNDPNPTQDDGDTDGAGDACDCDSMDPTVQHTPPGLEIFFVDINTLAFSPTGLPGSALDVTDIVCSGDPTNFLTGATCVGTNLPPWATGVTITDTPPLGGFNFYLAQMENTCPGTLGEGPAGTASDGTEHQIRDCP